MPLSPKAQVIISTYTSKELRRKLKYGLMTNEIAKSSEEMKEGKIKKNKKRQKPIKIEIFMKWKVRSHNIQRLAQSLFLSPNN